MKRVASTIFVAFTLSIAAGFSAIYFIQNTNAQIRPVSVTADTSLSLHEATSTSVSQISTTSIAKIVVALKTPTAKTTPTEPKHVETPAKENPTPAPTPSSTPAPTENTPVSTDTNTPTPDEPHISFLNIASSYSNNSDILYTLLWKAVGYSSDDWGFLRIESQDGFSIPQAFKDAPGPLYIDDIKRGSFSFSFNKQMMAVGTYRFIITNGDGNRIAESAAFKITGDSKTQSEPVKITIDGKSASAEANKNDKKTISWSATGGSYCVGSTNNSQDSDFGNILPPTGTYTTKSLRTGNYTYKVNCQYNDSSNYSSFITLSVN